MIQREPAGANLDADDDIDWSDVYKRLIAYGIRKKGLPLETAEEMAQEAIRRFFDPEYATWDRAKYPSFLRFLGSVVNGLVSDLRQRKGHANERPTETGAAPDCMSGAPGPEARAIDADALRGAVGKLLELAQGDPLVQRIVMSTLEGNDTAAEQAAALGVPVADVYKARERLAHHRRAAAAMMGDR